MTNLLIIDAMNLVCFSDFELFADEKRLCRNLISYLEKFVIVDDDELGDSDVPPLSNCSSGGVYNAYPVYWAYCLSTIAS